MYIQNKIMSIGFFLPAVAYANVSENQKQFKMLNPGRY